MIRRHAMPSLRHLRAVALLALPLVLPLSAPVRADILISPQRVTLSEQDRRAVVSLHNPGNIERVYQLEWVERRQTETGDLINLEDGKNPRSIAKMVRFSPRRVSVPAGQTQTIRLDYRPTADLAPGEYRSHLRIKQEPREGAATEVMRGEQDGVSFRLDALLSFSVPVFVRHGAGAVDAKVSAVAPTTQMRDGKTVPALKVTLTRSGEFGAYGRLAVYQQLKAGAPVEEIGEAGGVAMYAEIGRLERTLTLRPGASLVPGSWIRVTYEGEGLERGKIYSEKAFQVNR